MSALANQQCCSHKPLGFFGQVFRNVFSALIVMGILYVIEQIFCD